MVQRLCDGLECAERRGMHNCGASPNARRIESAAPPVGCSVHVRFFVLLSVGDTPQNQPITEACCNAGGRMITAVHGGDKGRKENVHEPIARL